MKKLTYRIHEIKAKDIIYKANWDKNIDSFNATLDIRDFKNKIVISKDQDNCAYFDQMKLVLKDADIDSNDVHLLEKYIIQVNLDNLSFSDNATEILKKYLTGQRTDCFSTKNSIHSLSDDLLNGVYDNLDNPDLKILGFFKNGFSVKYSDDKTLHYILAEKPSSSLRKGKLFFVEENIFNALEPRLMLDFNLSDPQVVTNISKFLSYRGLYHTDGIRINEGENNFELNAETVIVLKDYTLKNSKTSVVAVTNDTEEENFKPKIDALSKETSSVFDGEGLILPHYAKLISDKYKEAKGKKEDSKVFQIRMPFTKGILVSADFKDFISSYLTEGKYDELKITDYFGNERDLSKAKIIINSSMLKIAKELKALKESDEKKYKDPMEVYFESFHKYNHALYVKDTDAGHSKDTCTFSYQFLNSLDITSNEFIDLINDKTDALFNIPVDESSTEVSEEEKLRAFTNEKTKYKELIEKNPSFINDSFIKEQYEYFRKSQLNAYINGKLPIRGKYLFFSRDLLAYFLFIYENIKNKDENENIEKNIETIKKARLYEKTIYAPGIKNCPTDKHYPILRSPHNSPNEIAMAKLYSNSKSKLFKYNDGRWELKHISLYKEYFDKLDGLLMCSCISKMPDQLGGADFDGDHVFIYTDKKITDLCNKTVYDNNTSKYPLFVVSSPNGGVQAVPYLQTDKNKIDDKIKEDYLLATVFTIFNSCNDSTGKLSNQAHRITKFITASEASKADDKLEFTFNNNNKDVSEFFKEIIENKQFSYRQILPAYISVIAGLEIDAPKTGVHPLEPMKNINTLDFILKYAKRNYKNNSTVTLPEFIEFKKEVKIKNKKCKYSGNSYDKKLAEKCKFSNENKSPFFIDNLAFLYNEHNFDNCKWTSTIDAKQLSLYGFEEDDDYKNGRLDDGLLKKLKNIIAYYNRLCDHSPKSTEEFDDFDKSIYKIIDTRYDSVESKICDDLTVDSALSYIETTFDNADKSLLEDIYNKLNENNWAFIEPENRKSKLNEILEECHFEFKDKSDAIIEFLSDSKCGSYKLLPFLLLKYKAIKTPSKLDKEKEKIEKQGKKYEMDGMKDLELNIIDALMNGADKSSVKNEIKSYVRALVDDTFSNDINKAIKYSDYLRRQEMKTDKDGEFFWNIFTLKEIIGNIPDKEVK